MNKTKILILALVAFFVIASISITLLFLQSSSDETQNKKPAKNESSQEQSIPVNEEILQESLTHVMYGIQYEQVAGETPEFIKTLEEIATYQVLSYTKTNEEIASVVVEVSSPDLYNVVKALEDKQFESTEEMNQAITNKLKEADIKSNKITVSFTYDGNTWVPSLTDSFANAYYGGLLTLRDEYYESLDKEDWN